MMTPREGIMVQTVDNSIGLHTNKWDEVHICVKFLVVDAERILRIPLSEHQTDDFVAWRKTKSYMLLI
jgi:hypothetical protein